MRCATSTYFISFSGIKMGFGVSVPRQTLRWSVNAELEGFWK